MSRFLQRNRTGAFKGSEPDFLKIPAEAATVDSATPVTRIPLASPDLGVSAVPPTVVCEAEPSGFLLADSRYFCSPAIATRHLAHERSPLSSAFESLGVNSFHPVGVSRGHGAGQSPGMLPLHHNCQNRSVDIRLDRVEGVLDVNLITQFAFP